jgi:outer membrane protein OmpA-like peptidoglycan-associated protein
LASYRDIAAARVAQVQALRERAAPLLAEGEVQLGLVEGHAALILPSEPLFGRSSGQMSRKGQAILQGAALVLRSLGAEVLVAVHDPQGNEDTSARAVTALRAVAVAEVLERAGLPKERMAAAGYGASQGGPPRVELRILPDYESMPGVRGIREALDPAPPSGATEAGPEEGVAVPAG